MNQKVKTAGGIISIGDKNYIAAGGEAAIYTVGNTAYKLYHDPDTKMLPLKKIQELAAIRNAQVIIPRDVVTNPTTGKPLGYTTTFIDHAEPLLKLFTRTFKTDNNVSFAMINELVKKMQLIISDVHAAKCLVVDLNELNILFKLNGSIDPYFIDTDSYSTPSFKATAIMDSVRDRKVSTVDKNGNLHYNPTVESDWFSWSILAFWLYSNSHPYRGNHANYKPKDKQKQMDDGISVFHNGVRVPPSVNDFKVIPSRHLDWFKRVFLHGERGVPPLADSSVPLLMPTQIITLTGTDKIDVIQVAAYDSDIFHIHNFLGINYVATKKAIYAGVKELAKNEGKKTLLSNAPDGTLVVAKQKGSIIEFSSPTGGLIGTIGGNDMFARNNAIYTIANSKLVENTFTIFGNKIIHRINEIENVSSQTSAMYDGCVIQDLLGKKYLTLPYEAGACFAKHLPHLDKYRIVGAKADKNIIIVLGEYKGQYDRIIIIFDKKYSEYKIRIVDDVAYDNINMVVMDNGLCLCLASPTELELFSDVNKCEVIQNPPFDSTMKLYCTSEGIFFTNGNSYHRIKKK